jgi:hypothetical protein
VRGVPDELLVGAGEPDKLMPQLLHLLTRDIIEATLHFYQRHL